jgi:hypothetical protein
MEEPNRLQLIIWVCCTEKLWPAISAHDACMSTNKDDIINHSNYEEAHAYGRSHPCLQVFDPRHYGVIANPTQNSDEKFPPR